MYLERLIAQMIHVKTIRSDTGVHSKEVYAALSRNAILVDLGAVFALVALPTSEGVHQLNTIKNRLPNKQYGSMVGCFNEFIKQAKVSNELKEKLMIASSRGGLYNTFIRLSWSNEVFSPEIICGGTHQGLLLSEPNASFVRDMERRFSEENKERTFTWLLCSSANLSGDPDGSITTLERAMHFGENRGIELLVRFEMDEESGEKGSFPIVECSEKGFSVKREGPGTNRIIESLSSSGLSQLI